MRRNGPLQSRTAASTGEARGGGGGGLPAAPLVLRLSGQLLLGLARLHCRRASYLLLVSLSLKRSITMAAWQSVRCRPT